jgi:hypothetical protein
VHNVDHTVIIVVVMLVNVDVMDMHVLVTLDSVIPIVLRHVVLYVQMIVYLMVFINI